MALYGYEAACWQNKHGMRNAVTVDFKEVKGLLYLLTHLSPRMCLDLGKLELCVVGVHFADLLSGRGAKNLEGARPEHDITKQTS